MFTPADFNGVKVPGGGVGAVDISRLLAGAKDVMGLEIDAPSPVTAGLSTMVGNDVAFTGADPLLGSEGATVLPDGDKSVAIGTASASGAVTVVAYDASGRVVLTRSVRVSSASGVRCRSRRMLPCCGSGCQGSNCVPAWW